MYVTGVTPDVGLSPAAIGGSGGAAPHENRQPYRVLNYIICLNGVFPARP
jgi:microcystin-dependent protein